MTVYDALSVCELLLADVAAALDAADTGPVPYVFPGVGTVSWDHCCGQLSVNPERIYDTDVFPNEATGNVNCSSDMVAVQLVTTLLRCVPTIDDRGNLPTPSDLREAHTAIMKDSVTCLLAVTCSHPDVEWYRSGVSQDFVGAEGGCIAIETRVTFGIPYSMWKQLP